MFKHFILASRVAFFGANLALATFTPASAATITRIIDFQASDFFIVGNNQNTYAGPPTVTGEITVTFDPNITNYYGTSGIYFDYLSIPVASPPIYYYQPSNPDMSNVPQMSVGGRDLGAQGVSSGSNDFTLLIAMNATLDNIIDSSFIYASTSEFCCLYFAHKVQASFAVIPEPSAWFLMIGGTAFMGGMLRRARRTATATRSFAP